MRLRHRFRWAARRPAPGWPAALACALIVSLPGAAPAQSQPRPELERIAETHFGTEAMERGRAYQRPRVLLYLFQTAVLLGLAWAVALGPLGRWEDALRGLLGGRALVARTVVILALVVGSSLVSLPFTLIRFFHAREHGLRHDAVGSFFADWLKGVGIEAVVWLIVGIVVLYAFAAWPRMWWLVSWGAIAFLSALFIHLAPLVVDPIFNRITPLQDAALTERVLDVARRGGVPAQEVLVSDASRRTSAVNAYFTGLLGTRRIVLYDTLIEKFDEPAVLSVVAHEVGHWKRQHVNKGLALGLLAAGLGLFVAHLVLGAWIRDGWRGLDARSDALVALPAFALYLTLSLVALVPGNAVSRAWEAQADRTSLEITQDPESFIRCQVQLGRENLSDPLPAAWVEKLLYTHPSDARRIRMAETWR